MWIEGHSVNDNLGAEDHEARCPLNRHRVTNQINDLDTLGAAVAQINALPRTGWRRACRSSRQLDSKTGISALGCRCFAA